MIISTVEDLSVFNSQMIQVGCYNNMFFYLTRQYGYYIPAGNSCICYLAVIASCIFIRIYLESFLTFKRNREGLYKTGVQKW
ncbi:hypothetical protein FGM01_02825 [Christiangramia sabulilitoris]|uniref:Uncharacterized protein n=1 Tax=Christiangramia sabulilitoris TaxID=2583991 RepID=A0A550I9B3_9FLAO|nr:hypothetical protein FGM01_02825 [Christiangramia sabulilitoris]